MFIREVADGIVVDLLFDPDDESGQITRERALAIFKQLGNAAVAVGEDGAEGLNLETHRGRMPPARRFEMVLGFISMAENGSKCFSTHRSG